LLTRRAGDVETHPRRLAWRHGDLETRKMSE
jgi:hypothetical protein